MAPKFSVIFTYLDSGQRAETLVDATTARAAGDYVRWMSEEDVRIDRVRVDPNRSHRS